MRPTKAEPTHLLNRSQYVKLLFAMALTIAVVSPQNTARASSQIDIPGPMGSGLFGSSVTVLSNGNFVVADPGFDDGSTDIGAVYLYNGQTGALIASMVGSTTDDQVGSGGVFALPNGNYVVSSPNYDGALADAGAVSFCNGNSGCNQVGSLGSMFGDRDGVRISGVNFTPTVFVGITVLANGNFVVVSPGWTTPGFGSLGAVTLCSATSGCPATITTLNSLVGNANSDVVGCSGGGIAIKSGIAILANGNYVANSPNFDAGSMFQNVGASTFCSGTTGCVGVVSSSNSLVGVRGGDRVGEQLGGEQGVVDLKNGNYVVQSPSWSTPTVLHVGAVTFCHSSGCSGTISAANSLLGTNENDNVGGRVNNNSITVLTNNNYVVSSPTWDNGGIANAGAATFCSGTTGCTGPVGPTNSVVGNLEEDRVGNGLFGGAVALANGNYVVISQQWNGTSPSVGAVTFCSGLTGCNGSVSASNSLVGSVTLDSVGNRGVTALPNGSYVVISSTWDNVDVANVGAATFCSGTSGCIGPLSLSNSLVGSQTSDDVSVGGVIALTNGDYVVSSPGWNNGLVQNVGAATLCNGTSGCAGTVSTSNSLVGTTASDGVSGVVALTNGNYVVSRLGWDNGTTANVGAVTWCSGTANCIGSVSVANSLVGSTALDQISSGKVTTALPGGHYVVASKLWDNDGIADAGAISFGKSDGSTTGPITADNSVLGTTTDSSPGGGLSFVYAYDTVNQQLIVGRRLDNKVTIFRPGIVRRTPFDFDGDGRADISVFRASTSNWYRENSSDNSFASVEWGQSADQIVPADYDGDGKTDHAIYRDGVWWIFQSTNSQTRVVTLGQAGDLPRPGDFDGDGKADLAVFRPSSGTWWRQNSSNGQTVAIQFGQNGDSPMIGDFDGDAKTDFTVFRPSNGVWYVYRSSDNQVKADAFGQIGDIPLNGDFNGDGKADLAVFRPSSGIWYIAKQTGVPAQNFDATHFGLATDRPVPADYDGDGKTDIAVYRGNGEWYQLKSSNGQVSVRNFGLPNDKPIPAAYQP